MATDKADASYASMKVALSAEFDVAFNSGEIEALKVRWNTFETKESEKRLAMEQVLRDKVIALLYSKGRDVEALKKFLEFLLVLWHNDFVPALVPITTISDILDSTPIPMTERLFEFIEQHVSLWKSQPFFSSCKNQILRMCNDLLRRLSKAQNTDFCGRILLFLAMFFPFSERSGLNIVSEFNVDTFMKYGIEEEDLIEDEPLQTVEIPIKLDTNFYSQFWSLQEYFRSPTLCYNKKQWKDFEKNTEAVLTVFKNYKIEYDAETQNVPAKEENFFTKFLTNHKLLLLQLSDTDFRRTIYLQFLILFQFLSLHKSKDSLSLKSDQIEWVKTSVDTIHQLIKESPPDGHKFLECVQLVLKREEHWSNWKNEGCHALKKITPHYDKNAVIKSPAKKDTTATILHQNKNFNKLIIPRSDGLEVIDMRQDYLKYLPGRNCSPKVGDFLAECIQQSESSEPIDIKDKKVSDPQHGWIALKLLSLKSPHFFSANTQNPIPKLPEFVDHICRKIYREQNPGLLLPPLMPAPKTVTKDGKKEIVKMIKNESKGHKVIKLPKGQVKVYKTASGKVVKVNAIASPIKTLKLSNKTVKTVEADKKSVEAEKIKDDSKEKNDKLKQSDNHNDKHKNSRSSNSDKNEKLKLDKSKVDKERRTEKKALEKNSISKEKNSEKQFKKDKSPAKRKRSHDTDSDDKESSPASSKKPKDKREERREEKDEEGIICPVLTKELIAKLAKSISGSWKKVAEKLGYKADEIEYFESKKDSDYTRAVSLLLAWCSTEEDATPENLRQSLKTLGLSEAVKILSAS